MGLRIDELTKEGDGDIRFDRSAVDAATGYGFEHHEDAEIDPKEVEYMLTSGHMDDCCVS
jgi:hypothetical protein